MEGKICNPHPSSLEEGQDKNVTNFKENIFQQRQFTCLLEYKNKKSRDVRARVNWLLIFMSKIRPRKLCGMVSTEDSKKS